MPKEHRPFSSCVHETGRHSYSYRCCAQHGRAYALENFGRVLSKACLSSVPVLAHMQLEGQDSKAHGELHMTGWK
jgi:hypothetical protein